MSAADEYAKYLLPDDSVAPEPAPDLAAVRTELQRYLGMSGAISIVSHANWAGRKFTTDAAGIEAGVAYVAELDALRPEGIYIRGTTVDPDAPMRGEDHHTVAWNGFEYDLDFGKPGYAPDPLTVVRLVQKVNGLLATDFQFSGGGIYARWLLSEAVAHSEDVYRLALDIGAELRRVFAEAGYQIDKGVIGPSRVWRTPGSIHRKDPANPKMAQLLDVPAGLKYTVTELRGAFPLAVSEVPSSVEGIKLAPGEGEAFYAALPSGKMCTATRNALDQSLAELRAASDRHPTARTGVLRLLRAGERLHEGVSGALDELRELFLARTAEDGSQAGRADAFSSLIAGGIKRVLGDPTPATDRGCGCGGGPSSLVPMSSGPAPNGAATGSTLVRSGAEFDMSPFVLPDEFWAASTQLTHIRTAALASYACPDAVLQFTLARIAALSDHKSRVHTGAGLDDGASVLCHFVAGVGSSGQGKTTAESCTTALTKSWVAEREAALPKDYYREIGLGTGEGLIEAFLTWQEVPKLDANGNQAFTKKGEPLTTKVKKQTRHNMLVRADEGRKFLAIAGRQNSTISGTICELWMSSAARDQNAHEENRREIAEKTYTIGMTLGFQTRNVTGLFADSEGGAPQRFVFVPVNNPHAPEVTPDWPGALPLRLPSGPVHLRIGESARPEVAAWRLASIRGTRDFGLDGHRMLARARMAALLAQLHGEAGVVSDLMWLLAGIAMDRSAALRDALADIERQDRAREAEARHAATVRTQVTVAVKTEEVSLMRKAANALVAVIEKDGPLREGLAKNKLPKTLRGVAAAGLELALTDKLLIRESITGSAAGGPRGVTVIALPTDGEDPE